MSTRKLQVMVGMAVVSDRYRAGLLNGRRAELVREVGLEPEVATEVMAIQAANLAEFAAAVEQIVQAREGHYAPAGGHI